METKGRQINMIREHMRTHLSKSRKKSQRKADGTKNRLNINGPQEVEVVTTIRTKGNKHCSENPGQTKREVLHKVQKLQTTLRKDDLKWI